MEEKSLPKSQEDRRKREAEALRANLAKRKEQSRARQTGDGHEHPTKEKPHVRDA
jgi:hypothetical protein